MVGGKWAFEPDPEKATKLMIDHINKKRKALGLDKSKRAGALRHGHAPGAGCRLRQVCRGDDAIAPTTFYQGGGNVSKIIAAAAIRGGHKIMERAEKKYQEALEKWGPDQEVGFPNTGYYLPVIYGILGIPVKKLGDMKPVLERCRALIPPLVKEKTWLPYLAPALDAGMATFFAEEIIEAIRYLEDPNFYVQGEDPTADNLWLGAADDVILRKRGIEFVDGTAPGFAAILGAAPTKEIAAKIAQELQEKNLYVFMSAEHDGKRFSEQLVEAGVQIGWPTRLVSFGPDYTATVFAMGFATRAAMSFGGIAPGDYRKILIYNKDRVFAFALPLGFVTDEWYANAAGAINWGFPVIADTPIPQVLPTGSAPTSTWFPIFPTTRSCRKPWRCGG